MNGEMRCMATLRIFSELGSADDVTARLGSAPSPSQELAARRDGRQGASRTRAWSLSTEMREPSELAEHLIELLDVVEPLAGSLADLVSDGYRMDWSASSKLGRWNTRSNSISPF
jgi:hypothetical protein